MKIQWLGHSCFQIKERNGVSLIIDPYDSYVGFDLPKTSADILMSSHTHKDHNFIAGVEGNPLIINKAGTYIIKGIHISAQNSYHDDRQGTLRGNNLIFRFELDGVSICHMGDIGEYCNQSLIEKIIPVNILMIPVGGVYTINAIQAKEYIDKIRPNIVIPMHYKTYDCLFDIDKLDNFLDLFDSENIIYLNSNTIDYDNEGYNNETKIVVLTK